MYIAQFSHVANSKIVSCHNFLLVAVLNHAFRPLPLYRRYNWAAVEDS